MVILKWDLLLLWRRCH